MGRAAAVLAPDVWALLNLPAAAVSCAPVAMCSACGASSGLDLAFFLSESEGFVGAICTCGADCRRSVSGHASKSWRDLAIEAVAVWNEANGLKVPFVCLAPEGAVDAAVRLIDLRARVELPGEVPP